MNLEVNIVLHQTLYPGNLGSVARAMGNMGAQRLILIDPQCSINAEAQRSAVGCQKFLHNVTTYNDWTSFYKTEGEGFRIGFTARAGKYRPAIDAEELFEEISLEREQKNYALTSAKKFYLVFGREDSGLSASDVELLHHTCTLQTHSQYTSLNLAQAVLLGLYVFRRYFPFESFESEAQTADKLATPDNPLFYPKDTIKEWLTTLGFDISSKRINAYTVLNQLFLRNQPTSKELRILEVVLKQAIRKTIKNNGDSTSN